MRKLVLAGVLATLVTPAIARAGDVTMRVRDVPLGQRVLATAGGGMNFNMLGLHWIGPGSVDYRTRRLRGGWRAWRTADADEYRTGAWHDGNLEWTGASSAVQFRVRGAVQRLRSYELWSRVEAAPSRAVASADQPAIVSRAAWSANEEVVRANPVIAPTIKLAIVHHTAGTNNYTAAQSAAIVRGIELYHVKGNGWNDIGYNFLVDRFGTVYEGRGGGIEKNVVGAHALGFNFGTVGVSLMGNFSRATPTRAQQDALVKLLAWRLDVAHVDPMSTVVYTSGGNAKWRAGKLVTLRAISGHRDTGPSECPGNGTYALLPSIAKRVSLTGLPKLYSPTVIGALGGPIRFQARLSAPLAWSVTIADPSGKTVATGRGTGTLVDWTWRSRLATGRYAWTIAAPGIRIASGALGKVGPPPPTPFSLTNLLVAPSVIAPAADGSGGDTTVSFTLGGPAQVTAQVLDPNGIPVGNVFGEQRLAGNNTFVWSAGTLPDGRYRLAVTAAAGTRHVTKAFDVVVDRTVTGLPPVLPPISPNGDGVADSVSLTFTLTQNVPVRVDVEQGGAVLATPFQGQPGVGSHTVAWDGTANGAPLPDGRYLVVVSFTDALGDIQIAIPLTIDTVAPALTLVDLTTLRFTLSEPATVTALVNQKTRIELAEPKGSFALPFTGPALQVSAEAQDAAGNLSVVVTGP
jgi:N-acetylmuramoyl-L-alanine amidase/FlgD Ig-like domain